MPGLTPEMDHEIALFAECGPLRTWSVIVTVMGDLLRAPEDFVSGRCLAALVGRMGITEQALRVAVHRLRNDGWIESRRDGRESLHLLTAQARAQTEAARPRIYGAAAFSGPVVMVIAPPDFPAPLVDHLSGQAVALAPRCALCPKSDGLDGALLAVPMTAGTMPDWVAQALVAETPRQEMAALRRATLEALGRMPGTAADRLVLRLVILHHWRRQVLRYPPLADALLPQDWEGAQARATVVAALAQLPAPAAGALSGVLGV